MPSGARAGIGENDGVLILVLSAGSFLLSQAAIRWAWISCALGALIAFKDVNTVLDAQGVSVGFGLWLTAGGLTVAALLLFVQEIERIRRQRGGPRDT